MDLENLPLCALSVVFGKSSKVKNTFLISFMPIINPEIMHLFQITMIMANVESIDENFLTESQRSNVVRMEIRNCVKLRQVSNDPDSMFIQLKITVKSAGLFHGNQFHPCQS